MPKVCKAEIDVNAVKETEAAIRDLKNWIFVFAKEYDLPKEAVDMLHKKVDEVAVKVGAIACKVV